MSTLRWILALGTGAAFSLSAVAFMTALTDHRSQECLYIEDEPGNHNCADAVATMQMSGLIGVSMLIALVLIIRRHGRSEDA